MGTPNQAEYERNERRQAAIEEQRINKEPLGDRQEAREAFREAMADDPAVVAERISCLIDGDYGLGQMLAAKEVVVNPRLNREAILTQMIGVFEWGCPRVMGTGAWKKLTPAQKKSLSAAVAVVVDGPGLYVTNRFTESMIHSRVADHPKPFATYEQAEDFAVDRYRHLLSLSLHYLLPVIVIASQSRRGAEWNQGDVLWIDGKSTGPVVDPRQQSLF
jgi:hypothetical protein